MGFFPSIWKKYTLFLVEVVSELAYELCSWVYILLNNILTNMGTWCIDTVIFLVLEVCEMSSPKTIRVLGAVTLLFFILWASNDWASSKPNKIWALVQWHWDCFSGCFKQLSIVININIWNKRIFWVWFGCRFFKWCQKVYCLEKILFYNVSLQLIVFY